MDFFRVSEINLQKRLKIQKSLVMGMNANLKGDYKIFDNKMENKKVPELRAEAKRLGSKRS